MRTESCSCKTICDSFSTADGASCCRHRKLLLAEVNTGLDPLEGFNEACI